MPTVDGADIAGLASALNVLAAPSMQIGVLEFVTYSRLLCFVYDAFRAARQSHHPTGHTNGARVIEERPAGGDASMW